MFIESRKTQYMYLFADKLYVISKAKVVLTI